MSNIFLEEFKVGDYVQINGFSGKVICANALKTQIQSKSGEVKTIASSSITDLINFSVSYASALVDVTVVNNPRIFELISLLEEKLPTLKEEYNAIQEGPLVYGIQDIQNNNITIRISAKTNYEKKSIVERAIRKRVLEICNTNNIPMGLINVKEEK